MSKRLLPLLAALLLASLPFATVSAQAPFRAEREVRLLCGFAPGGTCDILSRLLADQLTPVVGQRVVVENRTGATGTIAAEVVARGNPDGHLVILVPMNLPSVMPVTPGVRIPFDVDRDITPIASIANVYNMLVVGPNSSMRSVQDVLTAARASGARLSYASTGNGSSQHLAGAMFARAAGAEMLHVPFRGGAPAIVEIAAGRVDMMFGNMPEFLGQIRDGGLRPLAYGASRPSPLMPDLPLISATIPGFEVRSWFGVFGPGSMSEQALQGWENALRQVSENPEFRRRMAENAMEIIFDGPAGFRRMIQQDRARWAEVIRAANIRAD